jgi:peptidoglycan/xylan/chitin deacetylase (PgdA/CDA1 family)
VVHDPLPVADWCFLEKSVLETQIAYIRHHFQVVPLTHGLEMLETGSLGRPTVAITFDDGYQNNYDVAFPILQQYDCPATIFLTTGYIDSDRVPWFCRLNLALGLTSRRSLVWNNKYFDVSNAWQRSQTSIALHRLLKTHHPYSIDTLVDDICRLLGVDAYRKFEPGSPYHMLRTDAIRALVRSGLIDCGAHTHNHAILSRLLPGEQQEEISSSIRLVETITGRTCKVFAYPNGSPGDYDNSSMTQLRTSGLGIAVSAISGPNSKGGSLLELRRYGIGSDLSFLAFKSLVHNLTYVSRQLRSNYLPQSAYS